MASSTENPEAVALVEGVDALEVQMDALQLSKLRITGRVLTYFGVLAAVTVGVVDARYLIPWVAATFVVACIPDAWRYMKYRSLGRERDMLIEGGVGQAVDSPGSDEV